MRRVSTFRNVPWSPDFMELFDLAQPDWTPPSTMRTVANAARDRLTCEARFERPDGQIVKVTSKCVKQADGSWLGTEEHFEIHMTFRPEEALR